MLFNLQNLFQTEDNEARRAGYKDLLGIRKKKEKKKGKQRKQNTRL